MGATIMWRDLPPDVWRVELGVGVGRVAVATAPAAKHHVAAMHCTLVHFPQVDRAEVDLEGALVAEGLQADIALDTFLSCCRIDKCCAQVLMESAVLSRTVVQASALGRHHVVLWAAHKVWLSSPSTAAAPAATSATAAWPICGHISTEIHRIVRAMASGCRLFFKFSLIIGRGCCCCHCSLVKLHHWMVVMIWSHEAWHQSTTK